MRDLNGRLVEVIESFFGLIVGKENISEGYVSKNLCKFNPEEAYCRRKGSLAQGWVAVEIGGEEDMVWMGETKCGDFLWKYSQLVTKSYSRGQLVWRGKHETIYNVKNAYCKVVGENFGHQNEVFQKIW